MSRRDLPGRDPYPQFEPLAWSGELDVELRGTPRSVFALLALALLCFAIAFYGP